MSHAPYLFKSASISSIVPGSGPLYHDPPFLRVIHGVLNPGFCCDLHQACVSRQYGAAADESTSLSHMAHSGVPFFAATQCAFSQSLTALPRRTPCWLTG